MKISQEDILKDDRKTLIDNTKMFISMHIQSAISEVLDYRNDVLVDIEHIADQYIEKFQRTNKVWKIDKVNSLKDEMDEHLIKIGCDCYADFDKLHNKIIKILNEKVNTISDIDSLQNEIEKISRHFKYDVISESSRSEKKIEDAKNTFSKRIVEISLEKDVSKVENKKECVMKI